jgi:hypothetical protein
LNNPSAECHGDGMAQGTFFDRAADAVRGIGHPEYPFLHANYSPMSRVPCRGFVEWIASAWLAGDTASIVGVLAEFVRANPGLGGTVEELASSYPRLVVALFNTGLERTILGLDDRQFRTLLAAFLLQAVLDGHHDESILMAEGRCLLAASILPYDFRLADPDGCGQRVNAYVERMARDLDAWAALPETTQESTAPMAPEKLSSIFPILTRMQPLTTSARMHFLDIVDTDRTPERAILVRHSLPNSTRYRTRRFGCYAPESSQEILRAGLVTTECPMPELASLHTKAELQGLLSTSGVAFKKSAKRSELLALVLDRACHALAAKAQETGAFMLVGAAPEQWRCLLEFYAHQATRLSVWVAGEVAPRLRGRW